MSLSIYNKNLTTAVTVDLRVVVNEHTESSRKGIGTEKVINKKAVHVRQSCIPLRHGRLYLKCSSNSVQPASTSWRGKRREFLNDIRSFIFHGPRTLESQPMWAGFILHFSLHVLYLGFLILWSNAKWRRVHRRHRYRCQVLISSASAFMNIYI